MKVAYLFLFVFIAMIARPDDPIVLYDENGKRLTELKINDITLNWSEEEATVTLTSWRLQFTLLVTMEGSGTLFYTRNDSNHSSQDTRLKVNNNKTVELSRKQELCTSPAPVFEYGKEVSVTLDFVSILRPNTQDDKQFLIDSGEFTVRFDDYVMSYTMNDELSVEYAYLTSGKSRLNSTPNGIYHFSDIELWQIDDRIIPEPSTIFMCLMSACGLMLFRRRK